MSKPQNPSRPDPLAREVERLLAGLSTFGSKPARDDPPPSSASPRTPVPGRSTPRTSGQTAAVTLPPRALAALWARVALGVLFGIAITQWPYPHACGLPLLQYFGVVAMVMVTGTWIAVASWTRRHAPGHVLALLLLLWGIALAAHQILPRVGYAAQRLSWRC
jgi:hypothetical protein